ncbi:MAG: hypothetical protein LBS91_09080 [Clostridiales Family XIII bacterium]|jgi:hypothetical protein|nr:hypothetical protein [Clostridiales Family XIII bacterium]
MNVGVKYCGGCRSGYGRKAEAARAEAAARAACEAAGRVSFSAAEKGGGYGALLVVCGCKARCADISQYGAGGRTVYIDHEGGHQEAAGALALLAKEEKKP